MNKDSNGRFSGQLLSLQLQLKTLLDEAGGQNAVALLDSLCSLSATEQEVALRVFRNVVERTRARDERLFTKKEQQMKELEDHLFDHILADIAADERNERRLSLVSGGKEKPSMRSASQPKSKESKTVSLAERRARRDEPFKPILN